MNLLELIDPLTLTGFARQALRDLDQNQFTLSRYFPQREVNDIVFRFSSGQGGLANTAKFRSYDTEVPIGQREPVSRKTMEMPPIGEKLFLSEYERYRLLNNTDEAVAQVYNDTATTIRSVLARMEVARGRALIDGALNINENGVIQTVDFGRDAGHSVTAAATWATTTTDILDEILSWMETYNDTNGALPGGILTTRKVWGYMLKNDSFRNLAYYGATAPTRLGSTELQGVLADQGIPPVVTNDAKVNVDGAATRIIDEDTFIFTPPTDGAAGATVYGTTLEAVENLNLTGAAAPGVVAFLDRSDRTPIQYWTSSAARGLPILGDPDWTFVADVTP